MSADWMIVLLMWCKVAPTIPEEKLCRQLMIECVSTAIHPDECFKKPKKPEQDEVVR
jgi:hypothetical protein